MASTKLKRSEIDRWNAVAISTVSKNTPTQQKAIDEANAALRAKKTTPKQKKKK